MVHPINNTVIIMQIKDALAKDLPASSVVNNNFIPMIKKMANTIAGKKKLSTVPFIQVKKSTVLVMFPEGGLKVRP